MLLAGALALMAVLATAGSARAHRLEAEYRVLPDHKVKIEGWFDLTGDSARGAKVEVFRPDGTLLAEGPMNEEGIFIFSYERGETLKVVVSAGAGHRKELEISAGDLDKSVAATTSEGLTHADRSARVSVKDVLVGLGFVLALAAFVLSLRNARQLRQWQRQHLAGIAEPGREGPSGHCASGNTSSSATSH
jgi:nickel transport protein